MDCLLDKEVAFLPSWAAKAQGKVRKGFCKMILSGSGNTFSFGHCLKRGRGGPCPNFLALFHYATVPYILTSISYYVILFGHF